MNPRHPIASIPPELRGTGAPAPDRVRDAVRP
jgi:hypothetical protein